MIHGKNLLALIPARGGSRRLSQKNVLEFNGKPMIEWTIDAGLRSRYVDRVVVSTDDDHIAALATGAGADVPFIRPAHLAEDESSSVDVAVHALNYLSDAGEKYDLVALLQPTSPLRKACHIDDCVDLFINHSADSVVSVARSNYPPELNFSMDSDLKMTLDSDDLNTNLRSQDFPEKFRPNGAIYLVRVSVLLKNESFYPADHLYGYKMNKLDSLDIDDGEDFILARALITYLNNEVP